MKILVLCLAGLVSAVSVTAAELPYTLSLACSSVTNLVQTKGAVLLRTGWKKFNRYVVDAGYCESGSRLMPSVVTTRDNPTCFVGYRCIERPD